MASESVGPSYVLVSGVSSIACNMPACIDELGPSGSRCTQYGTVLSCPCREGAGVAPSFPRSLGPNAYLKKPLLFFFLNYNWAVLAGLDRTFSRQTYTRKKNCFSRKAVETNLIS